ncbi:GntR family transcriptional regulator [Paenibacillus sp. NPDC056579]|uniref:GntR family transcriptional regulator n=1 Tax=Paenibacillus sp. NPDC056579 TaxID=3345871 RepID=UPI0036A4F0BE
MLKDEKPLYINIKIQIRNAIINGKYPLESKLPSVRELSAEFDCSSITTKRVYRDLAREGYIFTSQGTGTFVHADEQKIKNRGFGRFGPGFGRRVGRNII